MSPRRPKIHQIEDESARILTNIVPSAWVLRNSTHDYGIDREVEIFEDEIATAQLFKLQLKGSGRVDPNQPSVRVDTDTFFYWRNLDLPVLLVLVDVESGTAYGRWGDQSKRHLICGFMFSDPSHFRLFKMPNYLF